MAALTQIAHEFVYVMPIDSVWHVRFPGCPEAVLYPNQEQAVAAAKEFAWLQHCLSAQPINVRVKRPDASWIEIDHLGSTMLLCNAWKN